MNYYVTFSKFIRSKWCKEKKKRRSSIIYYPAITAKSNRATIFVIFIIGLTAGPAVSL